MSEFWYCLNHHRVEPEDGCANSQRLGPYPSQDEASRALEKVQERNEAWEREDEAEDGGPSGPMASDSSADA